MNAFFPNGVNSFRADRGDVKFSSMNREDFCGVSASFCLRGGDSYDVSVVALRFRWTAACFASVSFDTLPDRISRVA